MSTFVFITILLILPVIFITGGICLWNNHSKKLTQKEREDLIAKISIAGSTVTFMAIVYSIILNFYFR